MTAQSPASLAADKLQRCAELLGRHWLLALPTALASLALVAVLFFGVIAVVFGVIAGHVTGGHLGAGIGLGSGLLVALSLFALALAALYLAHALVVAASADVLADRPPNFGTAFVTLIRRLPDLVLAFFLCLAISIVPLVLCIVLIGIPLLIVAGYFLMYVPAAILVGGQGAVAAIATSVRIARSRVGESVVAWLGLLVANVVGVTVNGVVSHIPLVNFLVAFAVGGLTASYGALVIADFYMWLSPVYGGPPPAYGGPEPSYGGPPATLG
jgi:hypothetical protein